MCATCRARSLAKYRERSARLAASWRLDTPAGPTVVDVVTAFEGLSFRDVTSPLTQG